MFRKSLFYCMLLLALNMLSCKNQDDAIQLQKINKITLEASDQMYGYYMYVKPPNEQIDAIMLLLPGFGQKSEAIFQETKLHSIAAQHNILTIGFAGRTKMYADTLVQEKINTVLRDVIHRFQLNKTPLIIGGYSAGGSIGLRYAELCHEFPDQYPLVPKAVFMADAPIELFKIYELAELNFHNKYSEVSVQEAIWLMKIFNEEYGAPMDNKKIYAQLSPMCMDKSLSQNEIYLKDVAVRAYHDVDIAWRLKNRNQAVEHLNFTFTSELINRLLLLGNDRAEFIQTFETGYRSNGDRHPHSWSIIDEEECIQWIKSNLSM